ncbi:MAG: DUF362 domain-containing protein [Candidatus Latescibacterota bacterium]|nr:DUF362 domain-containing protein [Candidatus Latescibacterota bacterium]
MKVSDHSVYLLRVPAEGARAPFEAYRDLARSVLDALELDLPSAGTVFIKPNATVLYPADQRIITHPGFIAGLIEGLGAQGVAPTRITVGDGQSGEHPNRGHTWRACGYTDAIRDRGASLMTLNDAASTIIDVEGGIVFDKYPVYSAIVDSALLINAPLAKCHNLGCTTLSVKNLMGVLGRPERHLCAVQAVDEPIGQEALWRLGESGFSVFEERFYHKLNDLLVAVRSLPMPRLTVVDGLIGRDGTASTKDRTIHWAGA